MKWRYRKALFGIIILVTYWYYSNHYTVFLYAIITIHCNFVRFDDWEKIYDMIIGYLDLGDIELNESILIENIDIATHLIIPNILVSSWYLGGSHAHQWRLLLLHVMMLLSDGSFSAMHNMYFDFKVLQWTLTLFTRWKILINYTVKCG